jgi:hypothetical protein
LLDRCRALRLVAGLARRPQEARDQRPSSNPSTSLGPGCAIAISPTAIILKSGKVHSENLVSLGYGVTRGCSRDFRSSDRSDAGAPLSVKQFDIAALYLKTRKRSRVDGVGPMRRLDCWRMSAGEGEAGVRLDRSERTSLMVAFDVHLTCRPPDLAEWYTGLSALLARYFSFQRAPPRV